VNVGTRARPFGFIEVVDVLPAAADHLGEVVVASARRLVARDDDPRGNRLDRVDATDPMQKIKS
jgi:hypothetical protein